MGLFKQLVAGRGEPQYSEIPGNISGRQQTQVLNSVISVLLRQETATWGGLDLGSDGFWDQDYGWGFRVRCPFDARGRSSVRYGTRLGDLKENWFLLLFQLNTQHTPPPL